MIYCLFLKLIPRISVLSNVYNTRYKQKIFAIFLEQNIFLNLAETLTVVRSTQYILMCENSRIQTYRIEQTLMSDGCGGHLKVQGKIFLPYPFQEFSPNSKFPLNCAWVIGIRLNYRKGRGRGMVKNFLFPTA